MMVRFSRPRVSMSDLRTFGLDISASVHFETFSSLGRGEPEERVALRRSAALALKLGSECRPRIASARMSNPRSLLRSLTRSAMEPPWLPLRQFHTPLSAFMEALGLLDESGLSHTGQNILCSPSFSSPTANLLNAALTVSALYFFGGNLVSNCIVSLLK